MEDRKVTAIEIYSQDEMAEEYNYIYNSFPQNPVRLLYFNPYPPHPGNYCGVACVRNSNYLDSLGVDYSKVQVKIKKVKVKKPEPLRSSHKAG